MCHLDFILCYSANKKPPKNYYKSWFEEYNYSFTQNNVCYYDSISRQFYNRDNELISIKDQRVLVRASIPEILSIIEAIEVAGGIAINTKDDINIIKEWYKKINTFRKSIVVQGQDILESDEIKNKIKNMSFNGCFLLKSKDKDFSGIISTEELFNRDLGLLPALEFHKDDKFIISEPVEILNDQYGNLEYRIFVIDGEIRNISRNLFLTYHTIDLKVIEAAEQIINNIKKISSFPKTFCLDLMACVIPNTNIITYDIVEFNPLEATGSYLYNSVYNNFCCSEEKQNLFPATAKQNMESVNFNIPIYKLSKQISKNYNEPKDCMEQAYYKNGFSYQYQCAKKFGKADFTRFYTHAYTEFANHINSVDIVDILNNSVSLKDSVEFISNILITNGIDPNSLEFQNRITRDEEERTNRISQKQLIKIDI